MTWAEWRMLERTTGSNSPQACFWRSVDRDLNPGREERGWWSNWAHTVRMKNAPGRVAQKALLLRSLGLTYQQVADRMGVTRYFVTKATAHARRYQRALDLTLPE